MRENLDRRVLAIKLANLYKKLDGYNLYIHHIWNNGDGIENIKRWSFNSGFKVRYDKSMYFTLEPVDTSDPNWAIDYYFAQDMNRINLLIALPKEIEINGYKMPFSDNIKEFKPMDNLHRNRTYLNMFDVLRSNNVIPAENIIGAIYVDKELGYEDNSKFNPDLLTYDYRDRAVERLNIDVDDDYSDIMIKLDSYIDARNSRVDYEPDPDV